MKRWYLAFLVIIPLLIFLVVTGNSGKDADFKKSKELTALRTIGHHLLLTSGDSTSLVLPVRELSKNEFQIAFEKKFRLKPELLVDLFRKNYPISNDYAVEVHELNETEVLYSFVLSTDSAHTIVPCTGRVFPETYYTIIVKLTSTRQSNGYYIAGMLVLLTGGGIWLFKRKSKPPALPGSATENSIALGKYRFNVEQQWLELNGDTIELTGKETQLLNIFAGTPNQVIGRSRLLKEVWNDDGVMVTRSLDMFVSKLRKKLEADPGVKLVNVHGKGYKLELPTD
jgi:LPXTG-motif cell wall-anchored protein